MDDFDTMLVFDKQSIDVYIALFALILALLKAIKDRNKD